MHATGATEAEVAAAKPARRHLHAARRAQHRRHRCLRRSRPPLSTYWSIAPASICAPPSSTPTASNRARHQPHRLHAPRHGVPRALARAAPSSISARCSPSSAPPHAPGLRRQQGRRGRLTSRWPSPMPRTDPRQRAGPGLDRDRDDRRAARQRRPQRRNPVAHPAGPLGHARRCRATPRCSSARRLPAYITGVVLPVDGGYLVA